MMGGTGADRSCDNHHAAADGQPKFDHTFHRALRISSRSS
jgi:hypothetical protein